MKVCFFKPTALFRTVARLCLAVGFTLTSVSAQTPPSLAIQTYAGLTITGVVGRTYIVQTASTLASTEWQAADVLRLPSSPYVWVDTSAPIAGRRFYRAVEGATNLAWIPPGTFTMGSPSTEVERWDGEGPQTVVTLTRGFFIGKYEVTQGEYVEVETSNPSSFRNGETGCCGGTGNAVTNDVRHPVEQVSWLDATNYCGRLTQRERVAGRLPANWVYRLPTEAEWEYACRGGTTSAYALGTALRSGMANIYGLQEYDSSTGTVNNSAGIFLGRTTIVGSYAPNGWGLCDTHGNVWEWCSDASELTGLSGGRVTDPQGAITGSRRVIRGGSWDFGAGDCRSSFRLISEPTGRFDSFGFRVVMSPAP